ncbi:histone-lysine N-methyltransferase SETMAR [Trichonephila clavipes]|uniref:Histone-lysine N-methyltransferase SETMAR n=1 Tax=Trichonephila clavipes TaxID=2585209 RepID=A0A8X6VNB2_TRICX|nr:histone-lysine N-methyltransferase SETMAR [Trichonephila clavipes]
MVLDKHQLAPPLPNYHTTPMGGRFGCIAALHVGLPAAKSSRRICQAFGDSDVSEPTAKHRFQKFRSGDLSLCDKARSGRPQALNDEALQAAIEEDSSQTCGELARQFNTSNETV